MKNNNSKLIKIGIQFLLFIISLGIICMLAIFNTLSIEWIINIISVSITITFILLALLEKYWWKRIILFSSMKPLLWSFIKEYEVPILKENYNCTLKYEWEGSRREKQVDIEITQTYTSVNVTLISDEIRSDSIISEIIKQDNVFVLYYIYKTNPRVQFHEKNPIQLGGGKIILDSSTKSKSNDKLEGMYWTTSQTTGDMYLK